MQTLALTNSSWIDIEEHPDWEDKVDNESFPTLYVGATNGSVVFSGSVKPDIDQLLLRLTHL